MAEFERQGDKMFLRLLDLFLANTAHEWQNGYLVAPDVEALRTHLALTGSALEIVQRDSEFRLSRRVPEGIEQLAQVAIDSAHGHAGQHLAKAWRAAFNFEPDPSAAMTDAVRAVEAAAGAVVTPKDGMARLGKIVQVLRDQSGWGLDFQTRDDGHPDHKGVLIGMLESLAFAQRDRHSGEPPTAAQAQAHVQLASTLVFWFSNAAVARSTE
ncbi:hypothetical protein ASD23_00800 [Agromyces sp. Root1464]|nr:hypothetical protein ASD23_00800 [Agromyces sp. Root1464]